MSGFLKNKTFSTTSGNTLYTGVCNVGVIGVNPNKEELSIILGKEVEIEPVYTGTDDSGDKSMRLDFWLRCKDTLPEGGVVENIVKMPIFLGTTDIKSKDGVKTKYIDNKLGATYSKSIEELPDWFEKTTARPCKKGEEELMSFLSTLARFNRKDEDFSVKFENYDLILKGDVLEIKNILKVVEDNTVRVLLGVKEDVGRDKYYQRVYTGCFLYGGNGDTDYLQKKAESQYGGCNLEYMESMTLQSFKEEEIKKGDKLLF